MRITEPTSGFSLELHDDWIAEVGAAPNAVVRAYLPSARNVGLNFVATVEQPTHKEALTPENYVNLQIELMRLAPEFEGYQLLGLRTLNVLGRRVDWLLQRYSDDGRELCNSQLIFEVDGIVSTATFTARLLGLDLVQRSSEFALASIVPATQIYEYESGVAS